MYGWFACMEVCVLCACLVPVEAKRGRQISWDWCYREFVSCHVGARTKFVNECS